MSSALIRIVIADDHKLVRESWIMLLENNLNFKVVADCDNGLSAIDLVKEFNPDIILVDINMSPLNGFSFTEKMLALVPDLKIIGFSVSNQPRYATRMLELGAKGYLTKTCSLEEINEGINIVHAGGLYICEEVKKQMSNPDE